MSEAMTDACTSHAPDSPFGCCHQWGPPLGGALPIDLLRHCCNLDAGHGGDCRCKCGDGAAAHHQNRSGSDG